VIQCEQFYADIDTMRVKYKGLVYVGTECGDCYRIEFLVNHQNELTCREEILFKRGKQNNSNSFQINSFKTENNMDFEEVNKSNNPNPDDFLTNPTDAQTHRQYNDSFISLTPNNRNLQYKVHDCKILYDEGVEIVIMSEFEDKLDIDSYEYKIYIRHIGETYFNLESVNKKTLNQLHLNTLFKLEIMENTDKEIQFYIISDRAFIMYKYFKNKSSERFKQFKIIEKDFSSENKIMYSTTHDIFIVPKKNHIRIYDNQMKIEIYSIDFQSDIKNIYLFEYKNIDTEHSIYKYKNYDVLVVYDEMNYWEYEINKFRVKRHIKLDRESNPGSLCLPLNIDLIPEYQEITLPYYSENKISLKLIKRPDRFDILNYGPQKILKCFRENNHRAHIRKFAEFYFSQIKDNMYDDLWYGPFNPYLFAIYHNDAALVEELIDKYWYPRTIKNYTSPLVFAFKMKSNSIIKIFCEKLINRDYRVIFTRFDFYFLIRSNLIYAENLLITFIDENILENFPKVLSLEKSKKLHFYKDMKTILCDIHKKEYILLIFL